MASAWHCTAGALLLGTLFAVSGCERKEAQRRAAVAPPVGDSGPAEVADATPPAPPDAAPPPLETWDVGEGVKKPVWIRARDIDLKRLLWEMDPPKLMLKLHVPGPTISGTVEAPRDAVLRYLRSQLAENEKRSPMPRIRGRGRRVDLLFHGARVDHLMRLLAEVGAVNLAMAPDEDLRVDLAVRKAPWDGVLAAVARTVRLPVHQPHKQLYLLTSGEVPKRNSQFGEEKIDLAAGTTQLGPLLALLEWTSGGALTAPCDAEIREATAKRAPMVDLAQMLAIWSGAEILPLPNACEVPETVEASALKGDDWALVAVARGPKTAGLFRSGSRYALLPEGDSARYQSAVAVVEGTEFELDWGEQDLLGPEVLDRLETQAWVVGEKAVTVLGRAGESPVAISNHRYAFEGIRAWRRDGDDLIVEVEGGDRRLRVP